MKAIEDYVLGLGLDAYLVGGAVRDELLGVDWKDADFLVPGVDTAELKERLAPHGKVDDLIVADRLVGVRLYPRDPGIRALVPAGIEFAPPRREESTGPGRHDFVIVADPSLSVEDDMRRRDFTINAMARRVGSADLVDPSGGRADLDAGILRTVTERSFAEDPLRLVRGLRFVSQLDVEPDEETLRQLREQAASVRLVSGERVGGGLHADGLGELSKLLLGAHPGKALRLARDTGVLAELLPELAPSVGFDQESRFHELPLDEHIFMAVQFSADRDLPLRVRLAALFHDAGKPASAWRDEQGRAHYYERDGPGHEEVGAGLTEAALRRLRYPTSLRTRVVQIVRHHMVGIGNYDARRARKMLARFGEELALDLLDHRAADVAAKRDPDRRLAQIAAFRILVEQERSSAHRVGDLAVDGSDLIALGFTPGPALGRALDTLVREVVDDPELNRRDRLEQRARELLA